MSRIVELLFCVVMWTLGTQSRARGHQKGIWLSLQCKRVWRGRCACWGSPAMRSEDNISLYTAQFA